MKLVSVKIMREVERQADAVGISYAEMMQRAGTGLADLVDQIYGSAVEKRVLGLVGPGNNGGDVLVALVALAKAGWETMAYLNKPRQEEDDLMVAIRSSDCQVSGMYQDDNFTQLDTWLENATVLLDGLLGTGFELPLKPDLAGMMSHIRSRQQLPHIVAVDCPSAVNCDTGAAAPEVLSAEMTVCMGAVKKGLLQFPAYLHVGQLEVVDLSFPEDLPTWKDIRDEVVTERLAAQWMPDRPKDAHKGTFGSAVLAVGSINYTGAALLAGRAALRSGVGLVKMAVPGSLHTALAGHLAEATWILLPHEMGVIAPSAVDVLIKELNKAGSLLLGCGWGREDTTAEFLRHLLTDKSTRLNKPAIGFINPSREESRPNETKLPSMVVDADGLRLLGRLENWRTLLVPGMILTPHPGELAELAGINVEEIQSDRIETARRLAKEWGVVLVLKGAITVIANPEGIVRLIPVATTALSHGGTGDVLAGLIAGLLAQEIHPFEAAGLGCWIHAQAGLVAKECIGHAAAVTAGDVIESIGELFEQLAAAQN
jgi:NAD(P)H-hydrate epimerase